MRCCGTVAATKKHNFGGAGTVAQRGYFPTLKFNLDKFF
jgi:hypothetical protein